MSKSNDKQTGIFNQQGENNMAIQDDKSMPKSRVTLRYRTEINGAPEDVTLPLRILIAGDFSGFDGPDGTNPKVGEYDPDQNMKRASLDKRKIFDARKIIDLKEEIDAQSSSNDPINVNPLMKLLNINIEGRKFRSLDDFSPDKILENSGVEIKNRLETRRLFSEVKSNLSNNKRYLSVMEELLSDKENIPPSQLQTDLKESLKVYNTFN
ncbi:MAG: type VI secretion system contractile sheath small subunit [Alteromonadaceae bacterium]|nr:type VI secretion system contractile sheath small subunit [Alteromonadaceae bacterium]